MRKIFNSLLLTGFGLLIFFLLDGPANGITLGLSLGCFAASAIVRFVAL